MSRYLTLVALFALLAACARGGDEEKKQPETGKVEQQVSAKKGPAEAAATGEQSGKTPEPKAGEQVPDKAEQGRNDAPAEAKTQEAAEPEKGDEAPAEAPAGAIADPDRWVARAGVLSSLPADLGLVVLVRDYASIMSLADPKAMTGKLRAYWEVAIAGSIGATGQNILDPQNLSALGLDPARPLGMALLSLEKEEFVFFLPVAAAETLKETLYSKLKNLDLKPEMVGDKLLLTSQVQDNFTFLFKDDYLFIVVTKKSDAAACAKAFSGLAPDDSLGRSGKLTEESVAPRTLGLVYLEPTRLVDELLKQEAGRLDEIGKNSWQEQQLKEAYERGDSEEEINRYKQDLEEFKAGIPLLKRRQTAEATLVKEAWGRIQTLTGSLELLDHGDLRFSAVCAMEQGSLAANLFKKAAQGTRISSLFTSDPWLLLDGTVDVNTLISFIKLALAADGDEEDLEKLSSALGVDLDQEIWPLFTGEVGAFMGTDKSFLEMWGDLDQSQEMSFIRDFDLALILGISDEEKVRTILDRLAAHPLVSQVMKKTDQGWTIPILEQKSLEINIIDGKLMASTDPTAVSRLSGNKGPDKLPSVYGIGRFAAPLVAIAMSIPSSAADYMLMELSSRPEPKSEKYKELKAKLDEKVAAIKEVERAAHKTYLSAMEQLVETFGQTRGQVILTGNGYKLVLEHSFRADSLTQAVDRGVSAVDAVSQASSERWTSTRSQTMEMEVIMEEIRKLYLEETPPAEMPGGGAEQE